MASRLNLLFRTAPKQFLERTVLFTDRLASPESLAFMRNRMVQYVDLEPVQTRSSARVLPNVNAYTDTPLESYFAPPGGSALIPKEDPPCRFVFFPEFVGCRLLVRREEADWLRVDCEPGLGGTVPPAESQKGSVYVDSFAYWDHTHGHLVGRIRATAVLVKEPGEPWTVYMQQIVGTPGFEVVRALYSRALRY
ncbi:MAG TPA: hypothetical protein VFA65_10495 [Bryobacteraceae bacterium]|nr:hypothetical protein [Bryobacteraceae bacterium]